MTFLRVQVQQNSSQDCTASSTRNAAQTETEAHGEGAAALEQSKWPRHLVTAGVIAATLLLWLFIAAIIRLFA